VVDYLDANRAFWDGQSKAYQARHAEQLVTDRLVWGVWGLPEEEVGALAGIELAGLDVLELGCGGAQWSIALARRGARCTGVDLSPKQLEHARRLVEAAGVEVALVEAPAERLPLPDASFDLVLSDYGACMFCDPRAIVPEVARVLRPGGRYVFNTTSPLAEAAWPGGADEPGTELVCDYFDLHRIDDPDGSTVFNLPFSAWIELFAANDLVVERLLEPRPPAGGGASTYRSAEHRAWARRWPAEALWRVRRAS
jgi:SAM-dependent methyltransferase